MTVERGAEGNEFAVFFAYIEFEEVICFVLDNFSFYFRVIGLDVPEAADLKFLSVILAGCDFVFGYITFRS